MPADLGLKYTCFKCGSKFYDLRKPIPLCPKCGTDQRDTPPPAPPVVERKRARVKTQSDGEAIPVTDPEAPAAEDDEDEERESATVAGDAFDEEP
jgi:uncharacterized protein (TIGR02300 family)